LAPARSSGSKPRPNLSIRRAAPARSDSVSSAVLRIGRTFAGGRNVPGRADRFAGRIDGALAAARPTPPFALDGLCAQQHFQRHGFVPLAGPGRKAGDIRVPPCSSTQTNFLARESRILDVLSTRWRPQLTQREVRALNLPQVSSLAGTSGAVVRTHT